MKEGRKEGKMVRNKQVKKQNDGTLKERKKKEKRKREKPKENKKERN